ncbi:hypothetical protein [Streptomyces sporangiiformans]|uniref:Peptidase inhibitor family I36 n=1 Tax=Streptomyces sporangiiformans TaxID=2315329 RepID=A0A505DRK4_9ACTN|nr:hypothetical protein [Streptomyces sporangiiformans]TPQ23773.1 hypothetical protein FGD71_002160 [Streptomyces sporangiiformans]
MNTHARKIRTADRMAHRTTRRIAALAVTAAAFGGFTLAATGSAAAAPTPQNGTLENSEFGLYYNSGRVGCVHDMMYDDKTFANNNFKGSSCNGRGEVVNDNTASYRNRSLLDYQVWTDKDFDGAKGVIPSGYAGDASNTFKNEISSARFGD